MKKDGGEAEAAIRRLLDMGADVDGPTKDGRTLLMVAADMNMAIVVKLLLAKKASVNDQTATGKGALHCAAGTGKADLIGLLLAAKADPHLSDVNGRSALSSARLFAHPNELEGIRKVFRENGFVETKAETKLWNIRMRKDSNEKLWRADLDAEHMPVVGGTAVGSW